MAIEKVTGTIKMLGNSTVFNGGRGGTLYSVIEIGDSVIQSIGVYQSMDNYLKRGLEDSGSVTLWLCNTGTAAKRTIVGIQLPDGKSYGIKYWSFKPVTEAIFCTVMIPVLGLGLLYWFKFLFWNLGKYTEYKEMVDGVTGMIILD